MRKHFFKNLQLFKLIVKYELRRVFFKSIWFNTVLPYIFRYRAYIKLGNFDRRSSFSYLKLRCLVTDRSRFILMRFRLNRIAFKSSIARGDMVGLRKSSW